MNYKKYQKMYNPIPLEDRQWPNNEITHAPIWCSVDLRDGNQALVDPMNLEEKLEFFHALCDIDVYKRQGRFSAALSSTPYSEVTESICRVP